MDNINVNINMNELFYFLKKIDIADGFPVNSIVI